MSGPERIGPVLSARAARMSRAAERWEEAGGDLRGVPLEVVLLAVCARAEELLRDLDVQEVDKVARAAIDEYEQAAAEEAIASARREEAEREREEYLRRTAERLRLTGGQR